MWSVCWDARVCSWVWRRYVGVRGSCVKPKVMVSSGGLREHLHSHLLPSSLMAEQEDNFLMLSCHTLVVGYYRDCIDRVAFFLSPCLWLVLVVIRQRCFHITVNYMYGIYGTSNLQYFITHLHHRRRQAVASCTTPPVRSVLHAGKKLVHLVVFHGGTSVSWECAARGEVREHMEKETFQPTGASGAGQVLAWGLGAGLSSFKIRSFCRAERTTRVSANILLVACS